MVIVSCLLTDAALTPVPLVCVLSSLFASRASLAIINPVVLFISYFVASRTLASVPLVSFVANKVANRTFAAIPFVASSACLTTLAARFAIL